MSVEIRPLHEQFGAEVVGVDATRDMTPDEFAPIM